VSTTLSTPVSTPLTTLRSQAVLAGLRGPSTGPVHLPDDPAYEAAVSPWNLAVRQRPAAVATPTDAAEVVAVVRAARRAGLRVAPQSTGHNAGPLAAQDLSDVLLVRTGALDEVVVDPATRRARVGGGAVWLPAVEAAARHGLATLHGSSPDVGIAGYSLGGGLGWYARKLGLATNSVTAIELVTADGELVRADAQHEPDLFWALRGGGGGFGVVTAVEFRLYPITDAYAGFMVWDASEAERVLPAWTQWAAHAPDEVTTSFRLLNLPPLPEIPEPVRGRHIVMVNGAVLGDDRFGSEVVAGLRALAPEIDTFGRMPAAALSRLHMDPEEPSPGVSASTMLAGMPQEAVDAFLATVGPGSGSSLLMAELRQLGGALARPHPGGGVLDRFDGQFLAFGGTMALSPEMGAQGLADARRMTAALAPYASGADYLNFVEEPVDTRRGYPAPGAYERLVAVREAVDPEGLFVANHPVVARPQADEERTA
jgi:FAD/FMN-containing dehydrogenase